MSLSKKLTTETHLVNLALSKLGSSRVQISDVDTDNGEIFRQVDMFYFPVLEELVRMHTWQCCKKRNELAPYKIQVKIPGTLTTSREEEFIIVTAEEDTRTNPPPEFYPNYPKYSNGISSGYSDALEIKRLVGGGLNPNQTYWELKYTASDGSGAVSTVSKGFETLSFDPSNTYTVTTSWASKQDIVVSKVAPDFDWSCQHFIPPDAIRSFNVIPERNTNGFSRYKIDWVRQGDAILSNYNNAFLTYEGLPTVKEMDALFVSAFTTLLAARLATSLTGSRDLGLSLYNEFNNVIMPEARRVNGFEQNQPTEIDSAWLEATYTSNGLYSGSLPPFSKSSYGSFE